MIKLRKIFLYFLPWLVKKSWQKATKGTGTMQSAFLLLFGLVMYVPNSTVKLALAWHAFYRKALKEDGWPLKFLITFLACTSITMLSLVAVVIIALSVRWNPSAMSVIFVSLKLQIVYVTFTLLHIAYDVFEKEQRDVIKGLSDE